MARSLLIFQTYQECVSAWLVFTCVNEQPYRAVRMCKATREVVIHSALGGNERI